MPIFLLAGLVSAGFILAADIVVNPLKNELSGVDDEYVTNILLNINTSDDTQYFLRGVFFQPGSNSNNYCGYTWNGAGWYNGPISNDGWKSFLPVTIKNSSWSGELKAKIDIEDSGCKTSGLYSFKVLRYTLNSSSPANDNQEEKTVSVTVPTATPTITPTTAPTNEPTDTKSPTNTPTVKQVATLLPTHPVHTKIPTVNPVSATIYPSSDSGKSTVSGVLGIFHKESSGSPESSGSGRRNDYKILSVSLALVGAGSALLTTGLVYKKLNQSGLKDIMVK